MGTRLYRGWYPLPVSVTVENILSEHVKKASQYTVRENRHSTFYGKQVYRLEEEWEAIQNLDKCVLA